MNQTEEIDRFVNEIQAPARKKFPRRKVISGGLYNIVAVDLIDVSNQTQENRGYKWILTAIELYSTYAWALPLKTKNGNEVAKVLEKLFDSMIQKPNKLWADRGSEFYNPQVKRLQQRPINMCNGSQGTPELRSSSQGFMNADLGYLSRASFRLK